MGLRSLLLRDVKAIYNANTASVNRRYKENYVREEYMFDLNSIGMKRITPLEFICTLKLIEYQCSELRDWSKSYERWIIYKYLNFGTSFLLDWDSTPVFEDTVLFVSLAKFAEKNITGVDERETLGCRFDSLVEPVELQPIHFIRLMYELYKACPARSKIEEICKDWGMEAVVLLPGYSEMYASLEW